VVLWTDDSFRFGVGPGSCGSCRTERHSSAKTRSDNAEAVDGETRGSYRDDSQAGHFQASDNHASRAKAYSLDGKACRPTTHD
jgi:hypothetical protein